MVEAALQVAVMAVLSVRSHGEYRNATAAETTSLFETRALHITPDLLLCVLIQKGVSCHVSALKRLHGWTFLQTTPPDKHIINLGTWKGQSKH